MGNSRSGGGPAKPVSVMRYLRPLEAFQQQVLDFGAQKLSQLTGVPVKTIYNRANPSDPAEQLKARDLLEWDELSQGTLFVQALAYQRGGVFVPMPQCKHIGDDELYQAFARVTSDVGALASEFCADMEDGRLTSVELARLEKAVQDMQSTGAEFIARVRARVKAK